MSDRRRLPVGFCMGLSVVCVLLLQGCAFRYYDSQTGIEHIYGLGHFAYVTRYEPGGLVATANQFDSLGLGAASQQRESWMLLGVGRHTTLDIFKEDSCFNLQWQSSFLIDVRVGDKPPDSRLQGVTCSWESNRK